MGIVAIALSAVPGAWAVGAATTEAPEPLALGTTVASPAADPDQTFRVWSFPAKAGDGVNLSIDETAGGNNFYDFCDPGTPTHLLPVTQGFGRTAVPSTCVESGRGLLGAQVRTDELIATATGDHLLAVTYNPGFSNAHDSFGPFSVNVTTMPRVLAPSVPAIDLGTVQLSKGSADVSKAITFANTTPLGWAQIEAKNLRLEGGDGDTSFGAKPLSVDTKPNTYDTMCQTVTYASQTHCTTGVRLVATRAGRFTSTLVLDTDSSSGQLRIPVTGNVTLETIRLAAPKASCARSTRATRGKALCKVTAKVPGLGGGTARVTVQRKTRHGWRASFACSGTSLSTTSCAKRLPAGRYRARATFAGSSTVAAATSPWAAFRAR